MTDFNVVSYGAVGNGVADDTAAFQAAFAAACAAYGRVIIPSPAAYWKLTNTVDCQPSGQNSQMRVDVVCSGDWPSIRWAGPNSIPVFRIRGLKDSQWSGVKVRVQSGSVGVVGFDADTSVACGSTSGVQFTSCFVRFDAGATNGVGWRLGHVSGGDGDVSYYQWSNCGVRAAQASDNNIGWANEGPNSLNHTWLNGHGFFLAEMVTNKSTPGAAYASGGASLFTHGLGGSHNTTDFHFQCFGGYAITGGRFEHGKQFVKTGNGTYSSSITVTGAHLSDYDTTVPLVNVNNAACVRLHGCYVWNNTANHPATMVTLNNTGGATYKGSLIVDGGAFRAVDPFWTQQSGDWSVSVYGAQRLNGSIQPVALFA